MLAPSITADRVSSKTLLIVLVATLALLGVGRAVFAHRAGALIATGIECEECEPGGGGGGWPDDWGDFPSEAGDGPGYPDTGGYSGDDEWGQSEDDRTEYEREHESEIWELDIELKEDRDAAEEREAEGEFDTLEAEEELRRIEEGEEELQRKLDAIHNETASERLNREIEEVLNRHPELQQLKEDCEFLWNEAVELRNRPGQTPAEVKVAGEKLRAGMACDWLGPVRTYLPDTAPSELPRPTPGPIRRPYEHQGQSSERRAGASKTAHRTVRKKRTRARRSHRS